MSNKTKIIFSREGRAYKVYFDEKTQLWQNYNEVLSS